jgi:hypothetical protein
MSTTISLLPCMPSQDGQGKTYLLFWLVMNAAHHENIFNCKKKQDTTKFNHLLKEHIPVEARGVSEKKFKVSQDS